MLFADLEREGLLLNVTRKDYCTDDLSCLTGLEIYFELDKLKTLREIDISKPVIDESQLYNDPPLSQGDSQNSKIQTGELCLQCTASKRPFTKLFRVLSKLVCSKIQLMLRPSNYLFVSGRTRWVATRTP